MRSVFLDFATVSHDDVDVAPLRNAGTDLVLYDATPQSAVAERIRDADIVITNKLRLDRSLIESADRLRLVCLAATGTDNVDLGAAADRGVGVCNIAGYCTRSVVQHVFAVLLSLTHHVESYRALMRAGAWRASPQFCLLDFPIRELSGRHLGLVGLVLEDATRRQQPLPDYSVLETTGDAHNQRFRVQCQVQDAASPATEGIARNRRNAEQMAAAQMLEQLEAG